MTSCTSLDQMLSSVAVAVAGTQRDLDGFNVEPVADVTGAPLAFVLRQTQLVLVGDFALGPSSALDFSLVNRVSASLRGEARNAAACRVSVLIEACEPAHAG
jgi:hypothetical protein